MLEKDIEKYLVKRAKEAGGEVRKVQWIGRRGAPDRLVLLPGRMTIKRGKPFAPAGRAVWVELKAPGKKPTRQQAREHERMRALGQHVMVVDSVEGVDDLLR